MKSAKTKPFAGDAYEGEPSIGTLIVQKHRPQMNKFTDSERQQLLDRAMARIYAAPNVTTNPKARRR
ncbi:MAG: hypothetical protein LBM04_07300 [Opitutaceae bacterium]|nr:hypothetical protein [Opitutaceae bacterium]